MRMMLKFTLPVEKGNEAFTDGSLGETLDEIMGELKPEAAYFGPFEGKRGGMIFFDLAEPSQIVEVVEPLFLNLHAETELVPVMNGDDLRKGLTKAAQPTTPNPIVCFVTPTSENAKSIQAFKRDIADLRGGLNQINWQIFAANGTNDSNALDTKAKQATDYVANNVGNPPVNAVIVADGTLAASKVQGRTNKIPIVQAAGGSKPSNAGTNMTGFYLSAKTICQEQYDKLSTYRPVAVLYDSKNDPSGDMLSSLKTYAGSGNIKEYDINGDAGKLQRNSLKTALEGLNCNSFMLIPNALFYAKSDNIAKAVEGALIQQAIYPEREYKKANDDKSGKKVHGHAIPLTFSRAALYVDSLLDDPTCIGSLSWQEAIPDED